MSCSEIKTIYLYGSLGKAFGKQHKLAVETPVEALHALMAMLPGFRKMIHEGSWKIVRGSSSKRESVSLEELSIRFGRASTLHIIPAPKGAKDQGTSKVVIGALVVVASIFTYGAAAGWFSAAGTGLAAGAAAPGMAGALGSTMTAAGTIATGWGASLAINVGMMGVSMMLSGVSMLLAPQAKPLERLSTERNPSYLFTGPQNTSSQGVAMPLVYGKMRVGSILAGFRLETTDFSTPAITQASSGKTGVIGTVVNTIKNF